MQKNTNIIIKAALAVFAAVLATGCISERFDMPDNLQSVMVRLDVSAEGITKATEAPTEKEKAINTVRIFAYHGERLAGYFYRGSASTNPIYIDLRLPEEGIANVDFMVVVNEGSMQLRPDSPSVSERMSKADLSQLRFQSLSNTDTYGIPMYGTANINIDVTNVVLDNDKKPVQNQAEGHEDHLFLNYQIPVDLARPLAKMSVMASKQSSETLVIEEVKMLAKGTRLYGYLFPTSVETLKTIPSRASDRNIATGFTVNKVLATPTENPADYDDLTSGGIYLAEVPVGSTFWSTPVEAEVNSVVLEVKYSGGEGTPVKVGYIYMPVIERNKHYKVLCSFSSEGSLIINYVVADWTDATMWPGGLTFDYPSHSYLLPDTSGSPSGTAATMSTSSPFVGYFKMEGPENETFNPTLLDGLAADYNIEVYDGSTLLTSSDDYIASDKWYTIKVVPTKAENAGKAVRLAITYQAEWSEKAEYLLINGISPNFVWPYSGTDFTQDANYVIITQQ